MNPAQRAALARAIAASSLPGFSSDDRQAAFVVLQDLEKYENRVQLSIEWLREPQHVYDQHDITTATKLLALEILDGFLVRGYSNCSADERVQLRQTVLQSAQAPLNRVLGRKIAVILEGLIIRDFPQRWTTLADDLFRNLWHSGGMKVILEAFKLVAEDCTDSDFNAKISTTRRNDVLKGLNEISSSFLPLFFQLLQSQYSNLQQSRSSLFQMHSYLLSGNRTIHSMNDDERAAYQIEKRQLEESTLLLTDALATLEKFCATLPVNWMLGAGGDQSDFVAAFLHLLRDPALQVPALGCLDQLFCRGKLEFPQFMRIIQELPAAFQIANQEFASHQEYKAAAARATSSGDDASDPLTAQLDFHRALSRTLSTVLSAHLSHLYTRKPSKQDLEKLHSYLELMVQMLQHPSGRILTEQVHTWSNMLRESQIGKTSLLRPFCKDVLVAFMNHMVRVRWEDVEENRHPHARILELSFEDEEGYGSWMMDFRSRCSIMFRLFGHEEPQLASEILNTRVQTLLANHGEGAPIGFVDETNKQLTPKSEAVQQIDSLQQPMDNILSGIPSWALSPKPTKSSQRDQNDQNRASIRTATRAALSQLATSLVNWKPTYLWLKFRQAALMEPLRHIWKHDPSTLLQGIDTLIRYIGLPDEWNAHGPDGSMSGEIVGLKKKSGAALVAVSREVPQHLVPWLSQLSQATKSLLASDGLIPLNQTHLYEFLSCVAAAVENPQDRSNFVGEVLSDAVAMLASAEVQQSIQSASSLLLALGVTEAAERPESVSNPADVNCAKSFFARLFTPLNRLLSVGRRCHEAARKRSLLGGVAIADLPTGIGFGEPGQPAFPPDEGPLSLQDLSVNDPFVPLWPRILPTILQIYEVTISVWRPENQLALLSNRCQRYLYAISDDEAYLARHQDAKSGGGVFGEGGTAGSVVAGIDRRENNLLPKWSGWFNELRNCCFQLIGLLAAQRVLYAPEIAPLYPRIVSVVTDSLCLKSMEHRHFTQYLKHVVELLLITCPFSLYKTHLEPIIAPIFDHVRFRLEKTWSPVLLPIENGISAAPTKALTSEDCGMVAQFAKRSENDWYSWYYAHSCLFVGDLDQVTADSAVEKYRVDLSRAFSDVLQAALALKGDWALVLANQAREELAAKKKDASILSNGPQSRFLDDGVLVNADGTPKLAHHAALDARKLLRISGLCHFLLLESEAIAGSLTLTVIQCLGYPDAYTCRRIVKICHRMLETVAWAPQYKELLGQHMFTQAVKNLVTEPKWMVGLEWDMINVVRDIYCRLVLGQTLQAGGQGPAMQQPIGQGALMEQSKTVDKPLQGGGILVEPFDAPRRILASLPGIGQAGVEQFERTMRAKRSAKDQKDCFRDFLRVAADNLQDTSTVGVGIFDRAVAEESLLHASILPKAVPDIPEPLITQSQLHKAATKRNHDQPEGLVSFQL